MEYDKEDKNEEEQRRKRIVALHPAAGLTRHDRIDRPTKSADQRRGTGYDSTIKIALAKCRDTVSRDAPCQRS